MKKKILLVEDEKEIRETTKGILEREGYEVKTVIKTKEAWEYLQDWEPDLILLDIMLPGDIRSFVKKVDHQGGIKILYFSAYAKENAEKRGLLDISEQITGFIAKPFSIEELMEQVQNALETS